MTRTSRMTPFSCKSMALTVTVALLVMSPSLSASASASASASSSSSSSSTSMLLTQQPRSVETRQLQEQQQQQEEPTAIQEGCVRASSDDDSSSCPYDDETTCIVRLRNGMEYLVELGPFRHPDFYPLDDEITCECRQIPHGSGGLFTGPFQHPAFAGQGAPDCTCNPSYRIEQSWDCEYCAFEPNKNNPNVKKKKQSQREFVAADSVFSHPVHTCLDCTCRGFGYDTPYAEPACTNDDPADAAFATEEAPCGVTVQKEGLPTGLVVFLLTVGLIGFFGFAFWRWRPWVDRVQIEEGLDVLEEDVAGNGGGTATKKKRLPNRISVMMQYHARRFGLGRTMLGYAGVILFSVLGITTAYRVLIDGGPAAPIGSGDFEAMWGNEPGLLGTFFSLRKIWTKEYVFFEEGTSTNSTSSSSATSALPKIDWIELDRRPGESWDAVILEWRHGNSTLFESKTRNQWEATGENPLVFQFGADGDSIVSAAGTFVVTILYDHSIKGLFNDECDEENFSVRFMSTSTPLIDTSSSATPVPIAIEDGHSASRCEREYDLDHINNGNGIGVKTRSFKPARESTRAVELSRIELFEPPNQRWQMIRVKICRRQTDDSCSSSSSKRQFAAWRGKDDWGNITNPITIEFAEGEAIGKAIWVTIVGMDGEPGSSVVELYGREYQRDTLVKAVDQYITPIVGGALLVVSFLLYFYLRTSYYSGAKTLFQSKEALTPIEMASLAQCLEGEARLVPGGSWMDDIAAYTRCTHEIVSFLFPLRYSPTSRHERLMVLIFELGVTYFILACFRKAGVVAPTMIQKPSSDTIGSIIDDNQVDNLNESLFEFIAVALPVLLLVAVLEVAATYDLKKLYEMEREQNNVHEMPEIIDLKEKDPREKLKTGLSDLYYLSKTKAQKRADMLQTIFLAIGSGLWVTGLVITATIDDEQEFIRSWFRSTAFEWVFWFAYRPVLFVVSRLRTEPFFFAEPKDDAATTQALRQAEKHYQVEPLSEDEIRGILDEWLSNKTCYHQGALDNLEILECYGMPSFHYKFESFAVTSSVKTMSRYMLQGEAEVINQNNQGCPNGIAPQLPDDTAYETAWAEHEVRHEIPSSLAFGAPPDRHGQNGRVNYQEFVCFYGTPTSDYVCEFSDLPDYLIKSASGSDVISVETDVIPAAPLKFKGSKMIDLKSIQFIEKHNKDLVRDSRVKVLKQRHIVRLVPCWEIQFEFTDEDGASRMKNSGRSAPIRQKDSDAPPDENHTEDPSSTHEGDLEAVEMSWQQPTPVERSPSHEQPALAQSGNKSKSLPSDPYASKFFIYGEGDKKEVFFPALSKEMPSSGLFELGSVKKLRRGELRRMWRMLVLDDGKHYRNIEESMACVRAKALQSTVHAYTDSERIARKVAASKNPVRVLTGSEW
eukprot:CAMPEP_0117012914 /NCGR_PEP_ID=MMETSP0472-20121206/10757_1 /TAXON_ID=693140 ORGANISM="Tiarina fusus, Strain LIS" /NCGR_SAMPLE_ID=MMETSP0472 /ASSEMBLY_ACC=CAM_ASM_000603 /LENGTH=1396 /DNA_ID=CAMNT_0004716085 /DNA_START=21 /DNA_END=4207 /DNA_ORIENTATION=-